MKLENNLGTDPIRSLVWRIAIPSMLAQFVSVLYSIVDRIYISNLPGIGDVALAGVGVCGPVVTMIGAFASLVGIGGAPLMSIRMGAGKTEEARRILADSFLLLCVSAGGLMAAAFALRRPMLLAFGASEVTFPYANAYFTVYLWGTVFNLLSLGLNQFIICQGFAQKGMVSVVLGAVLNIALDPVFMFALDMGVVGAALATVISGGVAMLIDVTASYGLKLPSAARLKDMKLPDRAYLKRFVLLVAPVVANEGLWSMGMSMYNVFYGRLGDASVAAVGIAGTVDQLVQVLVYGVMNATAILVGGHLGAGDRKGAWLTAKRMMAACLAIGVMMGVVQLTCRDALLGIFNVSQEARSLASTILLIGSFTIWLRAFNSVNVVGILRAGGDTVFSMLLDTSALWLVGVPLVGIAALVWRLPVWQVYIFTITEEAIKAMIGLWRFRSGKWVNVLTERESNA